MDFKTYLEKKVINETPVDFTADPIPQKPQDPLKIFIKHGNGVASIIIPTGSWEAVQGKPGMFTIVMDDNVIKTIIQSLNPVLGPQDSPTRQNINTNLQSMKNQKIVVNQNKIEMELDAKGIRWTGDAYKNVVGSMNPNIQAPTNINVPGAKFSQTYGTK